MAEQKIIQLRLSHSLSNATSSLKIQASDFLESYYTADNAHIKTSLARSISCSRLGQGIRLSFRNRPSSTLYYDRVSISVWSMFLLLAAGFKFRITHCQFLFHQTDNLETKSNVSFRAQNRPTCPPPLPQHGKTSAPFPL